MQISIANAIQVARRIGAAAAEIITTNLKMWLGFETSETLGREEVVDGDFPLGTSAWTISSASYVIFGDGFVDIDRAASSSDAFLYQNILEVGKTYQVTFSGVITTGTLFLGINDVRTIFGAGTYTNETFTLNVIAGFNPNLFIIRTSDTNTTIDARITNVSVKELTQITPDKSGNNNVGELFTGKALEFDGSTDYVDVSNFSMSGKNSTFAFWINSNDTLGRMIDINPNRFIISFNNNQLSLFDGSWKNFGTIDTDVWNRCVIVLSGTSAKCYVNGVQLGVEKTITALNIGSATAAIIGANSVHNQAFFDGEMSDFQIYDAVWSTDDIAYDYANPNKLAIDNPSTYLSVTNLKAYWALSEGDGLVAYDSSGEGNNGTINGATYEPNQPRIPQLGMQNWSKGNNKLLYSSIPQNRVGSGLTWLTFASAPNTITVTYGQTAPDGTSTAWLVNGTGAFFQTNIFESIRQNRRSVWAKTVSGTGTAHLLSNNSNSGTLFNITNEWQRFDLLPISGQTAPQVFYAADLRGSSTLTQIIVWGPQIQSDFILNDYRPTDANQVPVTTLIPNPNTPTKDVYANLVRNRLNSFNLDGSGYAEVADDTDLDFGTGNFTLECWAKYDFLNQGSDFNVLVSNGDMGGSGSGFNLGSSSSRFDFRLLSSAITKNFGTDNMTVGNWYHLVVTREGTTLNLYRDTAIKSSSTIASVDVDTSLPVRIGRDTTTNRFYQNLISDVRLYNRALTSDEVENNYNAGLSAHTN